MSSSSWFEVITSAHDLQAIANRISENRELALDIETTGLFAPDGEIRLVQLGFSDLKSPQVVVIDLFQTGTLGPVVPALKNYLGVIQGHNLKFEQAWFLHKYGIVFKRPFDTMIASRLLLNGNDADLPWANRTRHDLWSVQKRVLNLDPVTEDLAASGWATPILTPEQLLYAAEDVRYGCPLREKLRAQLIEQDLVRPMKIELDALLPTAAIELHGMHLDREKWLALADTREAEVRQLGAELKELLGDSEVNLDSPKQLLALLQKLGVTKGQSTSRVNLILESSEHPIVKKLLAYRTASKRASTYGREFLNHISPATGRVHTSLWALTDTGRYSSSKPNLQNMPRDKEYRACFTAPEGYKLVLGDYSQIELRIVGILAQDPQIREVYLQGQDVYRKTAALLLDREYDSIGKKSAERQTAKAIALAFAFGMGPRKLATYAKVQFGVDLSESRAVELRGKYFQAYSGIRRWHDQVKSTDMRYRTCFTQSGWRRKMGYRDYSAYFNTPVQGSAAAGLKVGMRLLQDRLTEKFGTAAKLTATVHDELHVECPAEIASEVAQIQEQAMIEGMVSVVGDWIPIEAPITIGDDWSAKE